MKLTIRSRPSSSLPITMFQFLRASTMKPTISSGCSTKSSISPFLETSNSLDLSTSSSDGKYGLIKVLQPLTQTSSMLFTLHLHGDGLQDSSLVKTTSSMDGITELCTMPELTSTLPSRFSETEMSASKEPQTSGLFNLSHTFLHPLPHAGLKFSLT